MFFFWLIRNTVVYVNVSFVSYLFIQISLDSVFVYIVSTIDWRKRELFSFAHELQLC